MPGICTGTIFFWPNWGFLPLPLALRKSKCDQRRLISSPTQSKIYSHKPQQSLGQDSPVVNCKDAIDGKSWYIMKVVKWSMYWPNRNLLFQTHLLFITIYGSLNIRWCSCTPMCHWLRDITLSSNDVSCRHVVLHEPYLSWKLAYKNYSFNVTVDCTWHNLHHNIIDLRQSAMKPLHSSVHFHHIADCLICWLQKCHHDMFCSLVMHAI